MKNLAGTCDTETAEMELMSAGAVPKPCDEYGECRIKVMGTAGEWSLRRNWYYWVANGPETSIDECISLPKSCRAHGHVGGWGGMSSKNTDMFHIDDQDGLTRFCE